MTILHAHDGKRLAKQFTLATNGVVRKIDYDPGATWFTAETAPVASVHDLYAVLHRLEAAEGACVIRGALADGADPKRLRRKKTGEGAPFLEVPRRWLMLDIDGIPLPAATSILDDPPDAARALLDLLAAHAPELDGVTAIVQFSSSAGLDEIGAAETSAGLPARWDGVAKRGVAAHVWLWLEEPVGEMDLKRWMTALAGGGLKIDPSTNRTVQPHYTAAPQFCTPLRDPLAGRRMILVEGWADAAALRIPQESARPAYDGNPAGGSKAGGRGYMGHLEDIGGAEGFRVPMLRAVCSFVATTWPNGDIGALKADLRERIAAADPGARPANVLEGYASDQHIGQMVQWAQEREQEKRAQQETVATQPVAPTFPDRGVILPEADRLARKELEGFACKIEAGELPELLLRMTVGAGKSAAAIAAVPDLLAAARAAGRDGAVYAFFPRHDLGAELLARFKALHPTLKVAIWRGMDRPDPWAPATDPLRTMCADPELSGAAMRAGQHATAACKACPRFPQPDGSPADEVCGYQRQRGQSPDVWLMPHNLLFQSKPAGLPAAAVVVIDEAFVGVALKGQEPGRPVQLAVSALDDDRTGAVTGMNRERLLFLRRMARAALEEQDAGGILRELFVAGGFEAQAMPSATPDTADEWMKLEWDTKPKVSITAGMDRGDALTALEAAADEGFTPLRPRLAERVRDLLRGTDARSVNASFVRNAPLGRSQGAGDVVRFEWREDFAEWITAAPKLFLDATTPAEVLRAWAPKLEVADIEVKAPGQRVRQVVGAEFGRSMFTHNAGNVRRLADLVVTEIAATSGDVLVIAQAAVERLLEAELERRGTLPARLHMTHHGAITGMNEWENVARLIVVGRPAVNRLTGERLAELLRGGSVNVVTDGDASRWPTVTAGIRMADGTGRPVTQPRHPDALVEAVRWSITEGAVVQAIGRCRGVRRDPAEPVKVTILAEMALPLTVAEVVEWSDVQSCRIHVAAAEAVLTGLAVPLAPGDLARARPDLWPSERAAEVDLARCRKGTQTLIEVYYKGLCTLSGLTTATYRKLGARGCLATALVPVVAGRAALEAVVGPLSAYVPAPPPTQAQEEPMTPIPPAAELVPADLYRRGVLFAPPSDCFTLATGQQIETAPGVVVAPVTSLRVPDGARRMEVEIPGTPNVLMAYLTHRRPMTSLLRAPPTFEEMPDMLALAMRGAVPASWLRVRGVWHE